MNLSSLTLDQENHKISVCDVNLWPPPGKHSRLCHCHHPSTRPPNIPVVFIYVSTTEDMHEDSGMSGASPHYLPLYTIADMQGIQQVKYAAITGTSTLEATLGLPRRAQPYWRSLSLCLLAAHHTLTLE